MIIIISSNLLFLCSTTYWWYFFYCCCCDTIPKPQATQLHEVNHPGLALLFAIYDRSYIIMMFNIITIMRYILGRSGSGGIQEQEHQQRHSLVVYIWKSARDVINYDCIIKFYFYANISDRTCATKTCRNKRALKQLFIQYREKMKARTGRGVTSINSILVFFINIKRNFNKFIMQN